MKRSSAIVDCVRSLHPLRRWVAARRAVVRLVHRVTLFGSQLECCLCGGTARRFIGPYGDRCPWCDSRGRQRFVWSYLSPRLRAETRVLHLAPEPMLVSRFRRMPLEYTTADLTSAHAAVHVDITDERQVADRLGRARYDFVLCSHMLEHIPDDVAAMRVLGMLVAPEGQVLIQVPLDGGRSATYEDWTITLPSARVAAFGQEDHVRVYGRDFVARLEAGGLSVTPLYPPAPMAARMRLDPNDPIFICAPAASATGTGAVKAR